VLLGNPSHGQTSGKGGVILLDKFWVMFLIQLSMLLNPKSHVFSKQMST
jgi:hypothetical protein